MKKTNWELCQRSYLNVANNAPPDSKIPAAQPPYSLYLFYLLYLFAFITLTPRTAIFIALPSRRLKKRAKMTAFGRSGNLKGPIAEIMTEIEQMA